MDVAHALSRTALALVPALFPSDARPPGCRDERRHGAHECVRHLIHERPVACTCEMRRLITCMAYEF